MTNELVESARWSIVRDVDRLEGDDDFMPFMLVNGANGLIYVGVDMPEFGSPRDDIADVLMAIVVIHEGTEAVFASMAWSLVAMSPEERKQWGNRDFAEHPDRKEMVFIVYMGPDGGVFHSAPVTRENNTVRLGEWNGREDTDLRLGGRFARALGAGIALARDMPAEMVDYARKEIAAGNERDVMEHLVRAYRRARAGEVTPEERAEGQRLFDAMVRREGPVPKPPE